MAELLCLGFESTSGAAGSRRWNPVRQSGIANLYAGVRELVASLKKLQVNTDEVISDRDQTTDLSDSTFRLKTTKKQTSGNSTNQNGCTATTSSL